MKPKHLTLYVIVLCIVSACSRKPSELKDEPWQVFIRNRYGSLAKQPSLIFIVPEKKDPRIGLLMLPSGSDEFNGFAPIAFMADEDGQNAPPAGNPGNPNNPPSDTAGHDGDELVGPSIEELFPEPTGPRPAAEQDAALPPEQERAIDEKLDKALDSALKTKPDPDSIRFRIRVLPPFKLPEWWKVDTDPTPTPQPDIPDLFPGWKDVPFPGGERPGWWPLNEPWPLERFKLPDGFKPSDSGYKLGDWRIYIVPIQED